VLRARTGVVGQGGGGGAHHLVDAALGHHALLHAAELAELVLQKLVGRGPVDVDPRRRGDRNALHVPALLPDLLRCNPHAPRTNDLRRRRCIRLDLQPAARLAKLLALANIPRRAVRRLREPQHVVGVVVLEVGRPAVHRPAGPDVLAQLVLVDLDAVQLCRLARDEDASHVFDRRHPAPLRRLATRDQSSG